jgi:hypothetical protein
MEQLVQPPTTTYIFTISISHAILYTTTPECQLVANVMNLIKDLTATIICGIIISEGRIIAEYLITHLSQPLTNNLNLPSSSRAVFNALT